MGDLVTVVSGVHRHVEGSGTARGYPVHCPFLAKSKGAGLGHRLGIAVHRAVHRPIFPEGKDFTQFIRGELCSPCGDREEQL